MTTSVSIEQPVTAAADPTRGSLLVGLNPYGLTYTLGLQGAGTPRANPHATGLDGFLAMATEIGARSVEIHDPWLTDLGPGGRPALKARLGELGLRPIIAASLVEDIDTIVRNAVDLGARTIRLGLSPVLCGDRNAFGITGICPDAFIRAAAFSGPTASTIHSAADKLGAGDIILLEIHRAGPRHNFQARSDQLGYVAIEWWPDDFDAIRYANSRGIIVVEAAGNGAENLDDALYSVRPAGFPNSWTNPYNRANRDSGAVVVGAGAPPPGTHGVSWGADRSRLDFSNYGALIDAQGWGREVTSTGYGDLQGGGDARIWYTDHFSGTSSASPIVVGVLGALQGALRAAGKTPMTPATARAWLRATGSPQQDEPGRPATQRIGNRPDLKALIQAHVKGNIAIDKAAFKDAKDVKIEQKEFKNEKAEIKERKEKVEVIEGKHVIVDGGGKNLIVEGGGGKQLVEGGGGGIGGGGIDPASAAGGGVEARLAAVEQSVAALTHFIGADLRPDLGSGALAREADLSAEPDAPKSFKDSKDSKDMKDQENLGGY